MSLIGFELLAGRSISIQPDAVFSIAVFWNNEKIPTSLGKDTYHRHMLLLPNRRITGTGRIHHVANKNNSSFLLDQTTPCHLFKSPFRSMDTLHINVTTPPTINLEPLYRSVSIRFYKKNKSGTERYHLFLDPLSIIESQVNNFVIDLSHIMPKYIHA
ncbi:hypothetical protein [Alteribacillus iranensis]|uniref:Uncharacterized protein n=1 Tax=Alteribacillus iranensis TaxID=930128 RepID=A0A1I2E4Q5_9BACI|nr:hypothetical protein [Alteribacillus iranensis]SFE87629.1 hypothetical protein SAMN05192532_10590 [Alteribacillus iranensis]